MQCSRCSFTNQPGFARGITRLALFACCTGGCAVELGLEQLEVARRGQAQLPEVIATVGDSCDHELSVDDSPELAGAFALDFPQGRYWLFAHSAEDPTFVYEDGFDAFNWGVTSNEPLERCGDSAPGQFDPDVRPAVIELTEQEKAFETDDPTVRRVALLPMSGFVHEGTGYVFYRKYLLGADSLTWLAGTGVATLGYRETAERLEPSVFADEPTLSWRYPQLAMGSAALWHDGFVYVYGFGSQGSYLGRASLEDIAMPDRYEYWREGEWVAGITSAKLESWPQTISASPLPQLGLLASMRRQSRQDPSTVHGLRYYAILSTASEPSDSFVDDHVLFELHPDQQPAAQTLAIHGPRDGGATFVGVFLWPTRQPNTLRLLSLELTP